MALTLDNFKAVYLNALSRSNPAGNESYVSNLIENRTDVILSKLYNTYTNSNNLICNNTNFSTYTIVDDVFVLKFNGVPAEDFFRLYNITSFSIDKAVYYNGDVISFIEHIYSYIRGRYEPYQLKQHFLNNLFFTIGREAPFDLYYGTDTSRVKDVQRNRNIYVKATGPEPYTDMYIPIVTTGWSGSTGADQRAIPTMYQNNGWSDMPASSQPFNWTKNHYNVYANVGGIELTEQIDSLTGSVASGAILKAEDGTTYNVYIWRQEDVEEQLRWLGISRVAYTEQQATFVPYELLPDTGTDEAPYEPPTKTEKGQPTNTVSNNGGTGDRTSDTITKPTNPSGTAGSFGTVYGLNYKQMLKIQGEVWNPNFLESITSLTNAPQSAIIGAYLVPFEVTDYTGILNTDKVVLGNYEIEMDTNTLNEVWKLYPTYTPKLPIVTDYVLQGRYGGFLDFEPYTKMTLYLPYIGFKTVSPHHIYSTDTEERKISIYYNYDVESGQAKAILEVNGTVLYEWTASMGVAVSLSSSNLGAIKQQAALGTIGGAISIAGGITTHSTEKALEGAKSLGSTITGSLGKNNFSSIGSTGTSLERMDPQEAYLIIETTETAVPEEYNKNYGRPSLIESVLSELEGFTTVPNPLFESSATDTEKQEIVSLLQQGVIIKKE